ncbi:MAG TPA: alpha/beta fold hydrolase [Candidatus Acidoferrum sp.]|nr:alpha/beta fold hydrolase [Candidatus Acidoferrum sp.]
MPFAQNDGVKIYWAEEGQGEPVLLLMGLGWSSDMWYRTKPLLASKYRTITFDNRGAARSDVPAGPYPIATMASDAAAVLDAAGVESAHLYGVSMGGMIAQEFALQYPGRVKSLILGCTAAGGPEAIRAKPEVFDVLMRQGMTAEEAARAINPFIYDASTPPSRIEEDLAIRLQWVATVQGYTAQLQGIIMWEAYSRIAKISVPTLIVHGETDQLVPAENGKLIAGRISGSKLVMIPHASHIYSTDQPDAAHGPVLEFLSEQTSRSAAGAA